MYYIIAVFPHIPPPPSPLPPPPRIVPNISVKWKVKIVPGAKIYIQLMASVAVGISCMGPLGVKQGHLTLS